MKKIFVLAVIIGILLLLFQIFHAPERASGSARSQPIGIEEMDGPEQLGPPWYDPAWNYRKPVIITNSGGYSSYYLVLIKLTNINFDFTRAKSDGSDVRITGSDGTTDLSYFIEYWNSAETQEAYIWVRVFPLMIGANAIYIYFNNNSPTVESLSNGTKTFDGFDGFDSQTSEFPGGGFNYTEETQIPSAPNGINSLFVWRSVGGTPNASGGVLTLLPGTGIKSDSAYLYQAVGFRANFGSGDGQEWAGFKDGLNPDLKWVMIGDIWSDVSNIYLRNYVTAEKNYLLPAEVGNNWHDDYHIYEIRWRQGQSEADVDHAHYPPSTDVLQVPEISLPITFYNNSQIPGTKLKVDWVYVRQYRELEPIVDVRTEQGLVDLGITMSDSPDPLPAYAHLNYLITITNDSSAEASGVVITDTLPAGFVFVKPESSSGCNQAGNNIVCSLNMISANSTSSVTICAYPTADGIITNSAKVGSVGYELYLNNNISQVSTLVDSIQPTVTWKAPLVNRQMYITNGGMFTLEALASDNDEIAKVEFWQYYGDWKQISTVYTPPYQYLYNTDKLTPNQTYAIEVYAFDRAGNKSSLDEEKRQVIFIKQESMRIIYIALAIK